MTLADIITRCRRLGGHRSSVTLVCSQGLYRAAVILDGGGSVQTEAWGLETVMRKLLAKMEERKADQS